MATYSLHIPMYPSQKSESIYAHFSSGVPLEFSKKEILINGNEEPEGVYFVKSGFISVYTITREGLRNVLLIHSVGDILPLPWALEGGRPHNLFYESITKTSVLKSSKEHLRLAMGKNPWLSHDIFRQAVTIIALFTQRVQTLELRSSQERIISELLFLAERFGRKNDNSVCIDVPLTHQDIADSINLSRETVSKSLEKLFEANVLSQSHHIFTIHDVPRLQSMIGA